METTQALFNISLMVFIVATMTAAGFGTTVAQVRSVTTNVTLVASVFVAAFLIRPLLGWGAAELLDLSTAGFVATALVWSCPGAPIGVKLVMTADADVQSGAIFQVLLAAIGSITFAPTANAIIALGDLDADISIPVADLIKTIVTLQLVPFAVGMAIRHWRPVRADEWRPVASKVAGTMFWVVLAGAVLGSWETVVDLIGQKVLLATIIVTVAMILIGRLAARGTDETRDAAGLIQCCTNSGPAFAAVAIAFDGDPEILAIITALLLVQIAIGLVTASYLGRNRPTPATGPTLATA